MLCHFFNLETYGCFLLHQIQQEVTQLLNQLNKNTLKMFYTTKFNYDPIRLLTTRWHIYNFLTTRWHIYNFLTTRWHIYNFLTTRWHIYNFLTTRWHIYNFLTTRLHIYNFLTTRWHIYNYHIFSKASCLL